MKVTHLLRAPDIPSLVDTILREFYHTTFCCGHLGHPEEGVHIAFKEYVDGKVGVVEGLYCRDCADEYIKTVGASEVRGLF